MKLKHVTINAITEAISPLTHNSGTEGNESLIKQEPVLTNAGMQWVPCLSGNAIRHKMVRRPGADYLVERLDLPGKAAIRTLHFLFHGGALEKGSQTDSTSKLAEFWRIFPLLRLLGGSKVNQIIPGFMHVWRGMLVCEENRGRISSLLDDDRALPKRRLLPAIRFIGHYEYYRGSSDKTEQHLVDPADENSAGGLMPVSGQAVIAGALFFHGFSLHHVTDLEIGALLHSLRTWQSTDGTLGGQAARGHGRLAMHLSHNIKDEEALIEKYIEHVEKTKDEALAWLHREIEEA